MFTSSDNDFQQYPLLQRTRSNRPKIVSHPPTQTQLHSTPLINKTRSVEWYSLGTDPTENTVILLMWVAWYRVFHYIGTARLVPDRVATPLPSALLLLRDVISDVEVTCPSVACAIIVTPIGCLLCFNLVTALYMLQYVYNCKRYKLDETTILL